MPTSPARTDEAFQRAVREFEHSESERLFGANLIADPSETTSLSVDAAARTKPEVRAEHAPEWNDEKSSSRGIRDWLDPALTPVVMSLAVWIGLGIFAVSRFSGGSALDDVSKLNAQLADAQAAQEVAGRTVLALQSESSGLRGDLERTRTLASNLASQVSKLGQSLAATDMKLKTYAQRFGDVPPQALVQLTIPQEGERPESQVWMAATPELIAALKTDTALTQNEVNAIVVDLLGDISPRGGQTLTVRILPVPNGSVDEATGYERLYTVSIPEPGGHPNERRPEGGNSLPANATFESPR